MSVYDDYDENDPLEALRRIYDPETGKSEALQFESEPYGAERVASVEEDPYADSYYYIEEDEPEEPTPLQGGDSEGIDRLRSIYDPESDSSLESEEESDPLDSLRSIVDPDDYLRNYEPPEEEDEGVEGTKVFGAAVDSTIGSFQKAGSYFAGKLGFDEIEKSLLAAGEANQREAQLLAYESKYGNEGLDQFANITDSDWWEQTIAQLAPGSAPFMAGALAGGAAGSAVPVVGTAVGAMVGAMIGGGGTLFVQTIGDSYYDYLEQNPADIEGAEDYALIKSGATAVLNAASIPLGLAGRGAATSFKQQIVNYGLRISGAEVSTEVADNLISNAIDKAYINPDIAYSTGMAEAVVGGLLFDAPAIAVATRNRAKLKPEAEPITEDSELVQELLGVIEQTEAEVAANGGDRLDQVTASSKVIAEAEARDPNVRVKRLIDEETGEVVFEQKQTQAEVDAELARIDELKTQAENQEADTETETEEESLDVDGQFARIDKMRQAEDQVSKETQRTQLKLGDRYGRSGDFEKAAEETQAAKDEDYLKAVEQKETQEGEKIEAEGRTAPPRNPAMEKAINEAIDKEANKAATSTENKLPEPTLAQKEKGNYKKGHIKVQGLDISIENPRGSERKGTSPDGKNWSTKMQAHYGYIRRTEGADGDQVDVFVGKRTDSDKVFVVDQVDKDGFFDEHKVMLGYTSEKQAKIAYSKNYDRNQTTGPVTEMSMEDFKKWVRTSNAKIPISEDIDTRPTMEQTELELEKPVEAEGQGELGIETPEQRSRREAQEYEDRMMRQRADEVFVTDNLEAKGMTPNQYDSVNNERFQESNDVVSEIEYMSPDEYLKRSAERLSESEGSKVTVKNITDTRSDPEYMAKMKKAMKDGTQFAAPYLDYKNGGQEGNTRAMVAKEMDLEQIPVVIIRDKKQVAAEAEAKQKAEADAKAAATKKRKAEAAAMKKAEAAAKKKAEAETAAAEKKAKPTAEKKAKPTAEKKAKPTAEKKAKPTAEKKAKPTAEKKAKPTADTPAEPAVDESGKPRFKRLSQRESDEQFGGVTTYSGEIGGQRRYIYRDTEQFGTPVWHEMDEKGIPVDSVSGMPIGYTKDEAVEYLVDRYGEGDTRFALARDLDMSKEARLKRAEEQGFDIDTIYYHGTPDSRGIWESGFRKEKWGEEVPIFFSSDKRVANTYADDTRAFDYQNAEPETIPVYLKMGNPKRIFWKDRPFRGRDSDGKGFALEDEISKAKNEGHDGVIVTGIRDTYDTKGKAGNVTVIFEPSQVRSTNAAFAPEGITSADLLMAKQRRGASKAGISKKDAAKAVAPLINEMKAFRGKVVLAEKLSEVPKALQEQIVGEGQIRLPRGAYHNGKIYLFPSANQSTTDIVSTLLHEGVAHFGLRKTMSSQEMLALLKDIRAQVKDAPRFKALAELYELDLNNNQDSMVATEEYIAWLAEKGTDSNIISRVVARVREWLRSKGLVEGWTDNDIKRVLRGIRKKLRTENTVEAMARVENRMANQKGLDMSKKARMQRAKEMGFDTSKVWYHGTGNLENLKAFDPELTGQGNDAIGSGFYFTNEPSTASGYSTSITANVGPDAIKLGGDTSPGVTMVHLAVNNPIIIEDGVDLMGSMGVELTVEQSLEIIKRAPYIYDVEETPIWNWMDIGDGPVTEDMLESVAENYEGFNFFSINNDFFSGEDTAFRQAVFDVLGYDGVQQNFQNGETHMVAWFPEQIRSVNAAFDPASSAEAGVLFAKSKNASQIKLTKKEAAISIAGNVDSKTHTKGGHSKMTSAELGLLLDNNYREQFGNPKEMSVDEQIETVSNMMAHEVVAALDRSGNAANWYTDSIAEAMEIAAEIHPELKTDPNAAAVFKMAMAITSNGTAVGDNTINAELVYNKFKQDGTGFLPETGFGDRAPAMVKSFRLLNDLIREMGINKTRTFLDGSYTVKELGEMGFKVNGENVETIVPGSAILGPKIGIFYQNLSGNNDFLTMDLWFMRTWGRMTGTNMADFDKAFPARAAKLREEIKRSGKIKGYNKIQLRKDDQYLMDFAKDYRNRYARSNFTDKTELNKRSKNLYEAVTKPIIAPSNGTQRNYIRQVVGFAKDKISAAGYDVNAASLQALLWYPEKEFYINHGVSNGKSDPTDYAQEFRKLADSRSGSVKSNGRTRRSTSNARSAERSESELSKDERNDETRFALSKEELAEVERNPKSNLSRTIKLKALVEEPIKKIPEAGVVKRTYRSATKAAKQVLLSTVPRRGLVDFTGESMKAAKDLDALNNRMDGRQAELEREAADIVDKWHTWHSNNKDAGKALADLMHASTLVGQDPTKAYIPSINVQEVRAELNELLADARTGVATEKKLNRIKKLQNQMTRESARKQQYIYIKKAHDKIKKAAPEAIDIYNEVRDQNDKTYDSTMKMLYKRIEESGVDKDKVKKTKELLRLRFESGKIDGPYFTLGRFGEYWGVAKRGDETLSFAKFETRDEMDMWVSEWNKEEGVSAKGGEDIEGGAGEQMQSVDPKFMTDLQNLLGKEGVSESLRDDVWQMYLNTLPEMSARKHFRHRKGRMGFSQDALRSFTAHQFKSSHMIAKLEFAKRLEDKMYELKQQSIEASADDPWASPVYTEIEARHHYAMNPREQDWAVRFTSFGFHWYLGANPSTAIVNLTQTWILGVPILGAAEGKGGGIAKATGELAKASAQLLPGRDQSKVLTPDEQKAFKEFSTINLFEKTQSADLIGVAEKGTNYLSPMRKMSEASAYMFHHAEVYNREVTALAAYRMARKRGENHQQAILTAEKLTWDTHFDYSNKNRPRVMQQGALRVAFLFKNYSANIGYRMGRDLVDGLKGKERKAALTRLGGLLGMTALTSGVRGLPIWGVIYGLALVLEDDDEPLHVEGAIRSGFTELIGKEAAHVVMDGAIDGLTPLSISQRISLSNLFIQNTERAMDGEEKVAHITEQLLGPIFGGLPASIGMGLYDTARGDPDLALERLTPTAVKSWLQAARFESEGLVNRSGEEILPPEDFTFADAAIRASGFGLDKVSMAYKRNEVAFVLDDKLERRKSQFTARWVRAKEKGDTEKMAEIEEEIDEFNSKRDDEADKLYRVRLNRAFRARKTKQYRSVGGTSRRAADRAEKSGMQDF